LENEAEYTFLKDISVGNIKKHTYLNGLNVSKEIRTPKVSANVSTVSKMKSVRDKMVDFQRESAKHGYVLMDGRDIGTVVLPNADCKIFLTATPEERAKRRLKELEEKSIKSDFKTVLEDIKLRDFKDSHRAIAPLKKADDAIEVDTTSMSIEQVCDRIIEIINERMK
jgi:cytidylate kinase